MRLIVLIAVFILLFLPVLAVGQIKLSGPLGAIWLKIPAGTGQDRWTWSGTPLESLYYYPYSGEYYYNPYYGGYYINNGYYVGGSVYYPGDFYTPNYNIYPYNLNSQPSTIYTNSP